MNMEGGASAPPGRPRMKQFFLLAALLALTATPAFAQPPRAKVTPFVENDAVPAGARTRVALTVALPEKLHVQSDQPRDPSLIPTVLTIEPLAGVRVHNLVFPHPTDFKLEGQAEPLAVFEHEFVVGAEIELAAGRAAARSSFPHGCVIRPATTRSAFSRAPSASSGGCASRRQGSPGGKSGGSPSC